MHEKLICARLAHKNYFGDTLLVHKKKYHGRGTMENGLSTADLYYTVLNCRQSRAPTYHNKASRKFRQDGIFIFLFFLYFFIYFLYFFLYFFVFFLYSFVLFCTFLYLSFIFYYFYLFITKFGITKVTLHPYSIYKKHTLILH